MTLETYSSIPTHCTFAITYLNRCTGKQKSQTWFTGTQAFRFSDRSIQFRIFHIAIAIHCENNQCIRIVQNFKDIILVINTIEQIKKYRFKDLQLNQNTCTIFNQTSGLSMHCYIQQAKYSNKIASAYSKYNVQSNFKHIKNNLQHWQV